MFEPSQQDARYSITNNVPKHWVIVKLTNNETLAGTLEFGDISVCREDGNIILREPAKYNTKIRNYEVLCYEQIFIPASLVASIGTVPNEMDINRVSKIGTNSFTKEVGENERK